MKKLLTLLLLLAGLTANAKTTKTETLADSVTRLSKAVEKNPNDWQSQLELARIFLIEDTEFFNTENAIKTYDHIFHYATDPNQAVPDSVVLESGMSLMAKALNANDPTKYFSYVTAMRHFFQSRDSINVGNMMGLEVIGYTINSATANFSKALVNLINIRDLATQNNIPGIEFIDVGTAMLYDMVLDEYKARFGDKLIETTIDGKKYILIAMGNWNIEKPFGGLFSDSDSDTEEKKSPVFFDEDGKVRDDIHGAMSFSFRFDKDRIIPAQDANARMITVTSEQRQQMVEAYRTYMNKK